MLQQELPWKDIGVSKPEQRKYKNRLRENAAKFPLISNIV
jgi:hypothetical protein